MASSEEDDVMDNAADLEDDLFGDDDDDGDDDELVEKTRELSDRELDSGDDEERNDRAPRDDPEEIDYEGGREAQVQESTVWRHPVPKPVDGKVRSDLFDIGITLMRYKFNTLRLPKFLGIEPRIFEPETFKPPTSDHHTDTKSANFSASAVAASTMRYRKDPSTGELESNTVVYSWSDGSTTISVGDQHYELQTKPLAPPLDSKTYQEVQDSHFYVATPSLASQLLVMVGHMTNEYTVRPNKEVEDDALEKLQRSLAAATRGGYKGDDKNGPELITNTQDPELQRKKAEAAEKERMRAQRRREAAAEKAGLRGPTGGRGGLSVDDLEGRSGRRAPGSARKPAKQRRHRPEYDSDDDLPRGGRNREDEYDKEDDFLASSDEDLEEGGDEDEDEEEMVDEESERDEPKAKKQKLAKPEETSDADADAEADLDDDEAPTAPIIAEPAAGRGRKRNIIVDDDDE
jgi:RNA polymerase-associated protein LEO1